MKVGAVFCRTNVVALVGCMPGVFSGWRIVVTDIGLGFVLFLRRFCAAVVYMFGLTGVPVSCVVFIGVALYVMAAVVGTGLIVRPLWLDHRFGSMVVRASFGLVANGSVCGGWSLLVTLLLPAKGLEFTGTDLV